MNSSMLVTAGNNGCVQLFDLDMSDLGQKGKGLSHMSECRIGETSLVTFFFIHFTF